MLSLWLSHDSRPTCTHVESPNSNPHFRISIFLASSGLAAFHPELKISRTRQLIISSRSGVEHGTGQRVLQDGSFPSARQGEEKELGTWMKYTCVGGSAGLGDHGYAMTE